MTVGNSSDSDVQQLGQGLLDNDILKKAVNPRALDQGLSEEL